MRRPRMPRVIRLPFGYVVRVRYLTAKQMARIGLGDSHGAWVVTERTIYVNRSDHFAEQTETVAHELIHAVNDLRHHVDQFIRFPLQVESAATAMALDDDEDGE